MKFTPAGKDLFEKYLTANKLDIVSVAIEENEEGAAIAVNLITTDEAEGLRVIDVDGIKVAISEEDEQSLEEAVFDVGENEGEFMIDLPHHHHHHHGDGCCCGDDDCCCGEHEHEDGCCCGEEGCNCGEEQ
jgi:cobalamin biosynthesis protein CbiG